MAGVFSGNFSKNVKVDLVVNPTSAGTVATTTGASIDMAGYDGCAFICVVGNATSGATATLAVRGGATTTSFVAISGASAGSTGGADNGLLMVDVYKPRKRYLSPTLAIGTTILVHGGVTAYRYHARSSPVTNSTAAEFLAAPVLSVFANS